MLTATTFAKKYKIPVVHSSYEELLADKDIDGYAINIVFETFN